MSLSPGNLDYLLALIKEKTGIHLTHEKLYLLESRLLPLAKEHHHPSINALVDQVRARPDAGILTGILNAVTTNESLFFRDIKPFEQFRDCVIPYMQQHAPGKKHFRIWSAACSTGQEPYSIAMTLLEAAPKLEGLTFDILATDLASHVLKKAEEGRYNQFEIQRGVPMRLLVKYFLQDNGMWRINDTVRKMVRFRQSNLVENFSSLGMFDVIFCRNVLIYFDNDTKTKVLQNLGKQLEPHGVLFLGCTESIFAQTQLYRPLQNLPGIHTRVK